MKHGLLLSIAEARQRSGEAGWWMWDDGAGAPSVLVQSPVGFRAVVASPTCEAAGWWATAVGATDVELPGIIGEASVAATFSAEWATARGVAARPVEAQRLYQLVDDVTVSPPLGRMRPVGENDIDMLALMWADADEEAGAVRPVGHGYRAEVREHGHAGRAWVWEAGGDVCAMCFASVPAAGVVRLRGLYTPREHRSHGYATGLVAVASRRLRAAGHEVVLYTQLTNPASNRIYHRIGFRAVSEVLSYDFG